MTLSLSPQARGRGRNRKDYGLQCDTLDLLNASALCLACGSLGELSEEHASPRPTRPFS